VKNLAKRIRGKATKKGMSNRFLQKSFLKCSRCGSTQRHAIGYRPIANPMLFNSAQQCGDFHNQHRVNTGFTGLKLSCTCEQCKVMHSQWSYVDFQEFLDGKLNVQTKMTSEASP
jgi:hypothetical protein